MHILVHAELSMCFDFLLKSFFLQRFLDEAEKDKERCNREIEAYQKTMVFKLFKSQKEKMMGRGHFHLGPHSSTRFIHCHSFPFNNIFSSTMSTSIHFQLFQPTLIYFHQFHPCSFTFIHFNPIAVFFNPFPSIPSTSINFHRSCNYYHFTHELGFENCKNVCLGMDYSLV